jgi:2'-5' RNA ligase
MRLFVAVPVPEAIVAEIETIVAAVRAIPAPPGRSVRWVRLDGLHLTLRFVGLTAHDREAGIRAACATVATDRAPFGVAIAGAGGFPSGQRPRAIWLGVSEGAAELNSLATALNEALEPHGWPIDDRPLRPHLTLARSDGVAAGPGVVAALVEAIGARRLSFEAAQIVLYESRPSREPAAYIPRFVAPLGA